MITVQNKRTYKGEGVYIGRGYGSILGNPIARGKQCPVCSQVHDDPGSTLSCYRIYLWGELQKEGPVKEAVQELVVRHRNSEDITLICWCKPNPCHGDILKAAIEWMASK